MAVCGHALTHSALPGLVIAYYWGKPFRGSFDRNRINGLRHWIFGPDESVYEDTLWV